MGFSERARRVLTLAQEELSEILAGSSVRITTEVALEVATKQLLVEQAQLYVDDARIAIDNARKDVDDAQLDVDDAQLDVDDAQKALDEALDTSPEIIALFDGFITKVNVEGGDEVLKGTIAAVIADPTKFEADVMDSEMDILQVKLGGDAWVQVDAMQGLSLPAKVTHISPTATVEAGVVNYKVKVEIESLEAVQQEWQQVRQEEATQVMIIQWLEGQGGQQETPTMPEAFQLRDGLTVTVSLLVEGRNDVLLVPNEAITYQEGKTYVHALQDGVIEPCLITTGIRNCQRTEVTSGLNAGKQVIIH